MGFVDDGLVPRHLRQAIVIPRRHHSVTMALGMAAALSRRSKERSAREECRR
jgi:hypothetical protein